MPTQSAGMLGEILDEKKEGKSACYLIRSRLKNYIAALPEEFASYQIQREIVSNIYLDQLVQTVLRRGHIPPLVLIAQNVNVKAKLLSMSGFRILDGLQRTVRLKAIFDAAELLKRSGNDPTDARKKAREQLQKGSSDRLLEISASKRLFDTLSKFVEKHDFDKLDEIFDVQQWFEVWSQLSTEEQIQKMLILNAGHKPVKTRHQLELLFLNVLPQIVASSQRQITLVREKERSAVFFAKNRKKGEFHFAELIAALIAMAEGELVTTNANLITEIQNGEIRDSIASFVTSKSLSHFVETLLALEDAAVENSENIGLQWIGREVVLVGVFAAIGHQAQHTKRPIEEVMQLLRRKLRDPKWLRLAAFEKERNSQDLSKINVGTVNKRAVFRAFVEILSTHAVNPINWQQLFKGPTNA